MSYLVLALNICVGLIYTPYMLRMMGQSEFGIYSLVASVIAYLSILDLGFANAVVRYTSKFRSERKYEEQYSMFGMFLILYLIIGLLAFFSGLGLYFNVNNMFAETLSIEELDKARIMILVMIFNLAITFPFSIFGAIITAYEKFIFQKTIQLIRIILNTITMIALLELGYRAIGMVIAATIFNIISLLVNFWYCKKKIKIKIYFRNFEWKFLKEVGIYSFYIFLNIIMDRIYWSTGQFVLGSFVGTAAIAVFAVAIQLQYMYMSFSSAISGVFLPKVTGMTSMEESKIAISNLFIKTGRIQYSVMAFILTGFIVFGKQFIVLWAGKDYIDVYVIALLFFIPITVPLIQNLGITILQARNQMKFRSYLYIIIALISLCLQVLMAKLYGTIGVAIAVSLPLVVGQIIIMNIYYYKKQGIDIPRFWKEIFKKSISPLILGLISYFLLLNISLNTFPKLWIAIVIFSLVYFPIYWVTGMNQYEKNLIYRPLKSKFNSFIKS